MQSTVRWLLIVGVILSVFTSVSVTSGASVALDGDQSPADGTVRAINHDHTVGVDGSFELTVETANATGTTVMIEPDGFDVRLFSDDAIEIDDDQIRFLDVNGTDSTYTIRVNVIGGSPGDVGEITAWVGSERLTGANDERTSTVELIAVDDSIGPSISVDHPESVSPGESFTLTVETVRSTGTTVSFDPDLFDLQATSDDAIEVDNDRVRFVDIFRTNSTYELDLRAADVDDGTTSTLVAWIDGADREGASDLTTSTLTVGNDTTPPRPPTTQPEQTATTSASSTTIRSGQTTTATASGPGFGPLVTVVAAVVVVLGSRQ